nr:InlB B-repeat-containing protein [Clostridia bacterium]
MKRFLTLMLSLLMAFGVFSLVACGGEDTPDAPAVPEYTITFDYAGGTGETLTKKVKANTEIGELPTPSVMPTGKTFESWKTANGVSINKDTKYIFDRDITVFANYYAFIYEISYDANGGTLGDEIIRSYSVSEEDVSLPVPTQSGYTFLGWKTDAEATPIKSIPAGTIGALDLVAAWEANVYKITFNYGGGSGTVEEKYVVQGEDIVGLPTPTTVPNGKVFGGWKMQDGTLIPNGTKYSFADDINLEAIYSDETYSITYDVAGGNALPGDAITSYSISESDIALPAPTKKGYDFAGWDDGDGNYITVIGSGTFGNLDLTATWQPKQYTITFNYGDGEGTEITRDVEYDQVIQNLPVPSAVPAGKSFKCWKTESGSVFAENTQFTFDESITLIAGYETVFFTVELDNTSASSITNWADETTGAKTMEVNVGDTITFPAIDWDGKTTQQKNDSDYRFIGWFYLDKNGVERELTAQTIF